MNTDTFQYRLMELTALSGEFPADLLWRLGMGGSYGEKMITRLKDERLLKTHYRDKLRGYRLSSVGKKALLAENPERFSFYLTGSPAANRPAGSGSIRPPVHTSFLQQPALKYSGTESQIYSRPGNRLPCRCCPVLYTIIPVRLKSWEWKP